MVNNYSSLNFRIMKYMKGQGKHERFFSWAKEKMTPEDAMHIKYGDKSKDFPEEMKKEFAKIFNEKKEFHKTINAEKKAFKGKWAKYLPDEHDFADDGYPDEAHMM